MPLAVVPEVVDYRETMVLLGRLGYNPGNIARGSLGPNGYSDGVREYGWAKTDHWERIEAAMRLDESPPAPKADPVDNPEHYTSGPRCRCGRVIECITVIRDRRLAIGNAMKYLWRNGLKRDADKTAVEKQIEDLKKAVWFIQDEIAQLEVSKPEAA